MPAFGQASEAQLQTCHPDLQAVLRQGIRFRDFSITEGKRSEAQQRANVERGVSQTMQSKHVFPTDAPSLAVDVQPYPFRGWPSHADDLVERMLRLKDFNTLAAYLAGVANGMGLELRIGMDWDGDWDFTDQQFHDLPHLELLES